jgi:transposase-like protein
MDENNYSKRRNYRLYPDTVKRELVRDYQTSDCSLAYLSRKYGIGSRTVIYQWLKKYGDNAYLSSQKEPIKIIQDMPEDSAEVQKLKMRIRQLEKELEDARLLSEAYSLMIQKAEEELKIPIKKKYNTK